MIYLEMYAIQSSLRLCPLIDFTKQIKILINFNANIIHKVQFGKPVLLCEGAELLRCT